MVTTPCEPFVVDIGRTRNDVGAGPGVSVICHRVVTAPAVAVIMTRVVSVTGLVWIGKPVPLTPAGMVTVAGTLAAGESVERLTTNPDGPARPLPSRFTHPGISVPPVARTTDCRISSFSVGGRIVIWLEADTPLSVAVSVTTVGEVTCPTVIGNSGQACVPGIEIDAGTGSSDGCELVRATVAPLAGTPAVSCSAITPEPPL